jgi:hypothetical protein
MEGECALLARGRRGSVGGAAFRRHDALVCMLMMNAFVY